MLELRTLDGRTYRVPYHTRRSFELGQVYVGRLQVAYVVAGQHADLYERALATLARLPFAGPAMRAEAARYLAEHWEALFKSYLTGSFALVLKRRPHAPYHEMIPLDRMSGKEIRT